MTAEAFERYKALGTGRRRTRIFQEANGEPYATIRGRKIPVAMGKPGRRQQQAALRHARNLQIWLLEAELRRAEAGRSPVNRWTIIAKLAELKSHRRDPIRFGTPNPAEVASETPLQPGYFGPAIFTKEPP